jgi:glutamate-1-semialdehyde 2,1-aminomutase/spore coat polysaccharide biosynthesis protein SpsF
VATCGYHGWQDWCIGATSRSAGVPRAVCELAHPFPYGDLAALERLLGAHRGEFAAVIMEPFTFTTPPAGYLAGVRELAHAHGALLIFDEIVTGFRLALGGAQERFGVVPDLAAFGKGLGNGYPISAIVGRRDVMAILEDAFVSFTFAGETSAMAAALAVLDVLEHTDALSRLEAAGRMLADGARAMAEAAGLGARVQLLGDPRWTLVRFVDAAGQEDPLLRALWTQEVTRRGVLILATHNVSAAHDYSAVEHALCAYAEAFRRVAHLVATGAALEAHLDGPVPTPAFRVRG